MKFNKKIILFLASLLSLVAYFVFHSNSNENKDNLNLFVDKVSADSPTESVAGSITTSGSEGIQGSGSASAAESCGSTGGSESESQGESE